MRVSTLGGGHRRLVTSMVLIALFTAAFPGAVVAADEPTVPVEAHQFAMVSRGGLSQWRIGGSNVECTMDNVQWVTRDSFDYSGLRNGEKWIGLTGGYYGWHFCGTTDWTETLLGDHVCTITGFGKVLMEDGRTIYINHFEIIETRPWDPAPRFSGSYTDSDGHAGTVTGALYPNLGPVCWGSDAAAVLALHPSP